MMTEAAEQARDRRIEEAIRVRGRGGAAFNDRAHPRDREGKFRTILGRIAAASLPREPHFGGRGGLQGLNAQNAARSILSGVAPSDLPEEQRSALLGQLDAYIHSRPGEKDAVMLRSRLVGHSPHQAAVAADLHAELAKARRTGASGPRHGGYIEALRTAVDHPSLDSLQRMDSTDRPEVDGAGTPPREWQAGHADGIKRAIEIAKKHEPEPSKTVADKLRDEGHHVPSWWSETQAHEYAHEVRSDAAKGVAKPHEDLPLRELKPGAEVADPNTGKGYTVVAHEGGTGARGLTRLRPHDVLQPERTALSHESWQVVRGEKRKVPAERSAATKPKVGDVMARPSGQVRTGSELVVYRSDGSKQRLPVEGTMLDAQAHAADVLREKGVYRVGLEDPMRGKETWSTDDSWFVPDTGMAGSDDTPSKPDVQSMTPKDIDVELARIWGDEKRWEHYIQSTMAMHERDRARDARRGARPRELDDRQKEQLAGYEKNLAAARAEAKPFNDEFQRRGGWQRYFLVTNGNGHVHKGMNCSTCRRTTQYAWLIELADKPHKEMVDEFGESACTTCFPDAPSMYQKMKAAGHISGAQRADDAQRAERQAERARRQAAKDEKGIKAPDGTPLRITKVWSARPEEVKSLVTARRELVESLLDFFNRAHATGGYATPEAHAKIDANIAALIAAIAHKTGESESAVRAEHMAKAQKKWKKDYRNPYQGTEWTP